MQLPNRYRAYLDPAKLTYLLTHPSKAGLFRAAGFNEDNVDTLEQGLLLIGQTQPVVEVEVTPYGTKYVIEGHIQVPDKELWPMRTVWIIEPDEEAPRFVTARPPKP